MIYPKKIKAKKSDKIIKILIGVSILVAILLWVTNRQIVPTIPWAAIMNAGIVYTWIVVLYSIRKNMNIAGHVLLQVIALSVFMVYIDYKLGMKGWSIHIAIPIMIMIANMTMLVLTIVSYKKYIKYVVYQLITLILSVGMIIFMTEYDVVNKTLSQVASGICILNFIVCLGLCAKEIKEAVVRKFHM